MIDHDPDPGTDPLAGRDPHPREQIDLWPLHDARQALLEEIVSQPGAGSTAAPAARRVLIPVGIAAAIALVVGGAWFAVSGDDSGGEDDQVVAATSEERTASEPTTEPTTEATTPTSEPTKDRRRDKQPEVRLNGVEIGRVASLNKCLRVLDHLDAEEVEALRLRASRRKGGARYVVRLADQDVRFVARDHRCHVLQVGPKERRSR
ncbi:hypothetical protein [Nocardioides bizhenqiangii]|uniref:Uncharacterized protein n=1 Tax=Nocardioides bizhenqiangii TaxID=3095076 RepID=A0ABZ0ZP13_9ACTN|nr:MULTISPECIES: hypothetical protein [unclassified Nocardioides]MDZ5619922.1 hypothetical protein [Nocardioides sp. HM23]WQQ26075.1 hypothetical protein SHK19_19180 [Nocardioides sp. HM61]